MTDRTAIAKALSLYSETQQTALKATLEKFGERVEALYPYCNADGTPEWGQIRLSEGGSKTFRAYHLDGDVVVMKKLAKPDHGFALFGGQLPARYPDATIFVCEGEKATYAVIRHAHTNHQLERFIAVTSGSAQSARNADWRSLYGRNVVIWPDNDAAGANYARDVAAQLAGKAASVTFVDVTRLSVGPADDAADWAETLDQQTFNTLDSLPTITHFEQAEATSSSPSDNEAPLPLLRESGAPDDFPLDALGRLLGPAARSIARAVQCPEGLVGCSVLGAASLIVQGLRDVTNDGRVTPLSLYMLSIAKSGERKTAVDTLANRAIRKHQKVEQARYTHEMKAYQAAMKALAKGEIEPDKPIDPTMLVQDVTPDALIRGLITGHRVQGLFLSEGASFLNGYAMSQENQLRTAAALSSIWSAEAISQSRITGRFTADGRRLAIHLQVQPEVVANFLGNDHLQAQGLIPRFLMSEPKSMIGTRRYGRVNILEDHAFIAYDTQLAHLLEQPLPIDDYGDLSPRALVLSDAAYECWVDAYNAIEEASAPGGALENYQAYASKLAEQILRIAGVITTFEDPDAVEIPEATMRGAIQLGNYFLHEAMRLLLGPADRQLARAKELLEWLKRYPSPMALRDVYRTGPKFVRSAAQARELLGILMEHGWVRQHEGRLTSSDGKVSRENYAVVTDV